MPSAHLSTPHTSSSFCDLDGRPGTHSPPDITLTGRRGHSRFILTFQGSSLIPRLTLHLHLSVTNSAQTHTTDWLSLCKPPARTDFPEVEDGNNKTKDRFLPSRNSVSITAKASQNSRQTRHYFLPTVWKYGEENLAMIPLLVLPEVTLFFSLRH